MSPKARLDLRVRKDGQAVESTSTAQPVEIEAKRRLNSTSPTSRRCASAADDAKPRRRLRALEDRWNREVAPHLVAAGVTDLDGLDAKIAEAQELDAGIKDEGYGDGVAACPDTSTRRRSGGAARSVDRARSAGPHSETWRLRHWPLISTALGADPIAGLRKRRQDLSKSVETARTDRRRGCEGPHTIALRAHCQLRSALDAAISKRDAALTSFPEGVDAALAAAQAALAAANAEKQSVAAEFASLESTIDARKRANRRGLERRAHESRDCKQHAVETAQEKLTAAITSHASEHRCDSSSCEDSAMPRISLAAETRLHEATERHAALPVPERNVTEDEVNAAKNCCG